MSANAVVRARIDEHIKEEATVVLAAMGLTVSDAFRLMLTRVAREKPLPFDPLVIFKKKSIMMNDVTSSIISR
ncbi:type II toxin-antitoxin system RelB/DinJ family antitoxin [Acidithiobacillus thiooxidans]|uniref:type II toxin-antitoxin system RelB/DinJ family antitoxin n=1 Tax=Acidithiobacillus thiooxidans TaxID=930 RepID=UPI00242DAEE7|nr:type II toxin-antitoxin system RelB/DinJ family antitoxin [Acidithiobacillus thiooxidans]